MSKIKVDQLETLDGTKTINIADLGATTAVSVANTPAGNIAATTVQAAINELDSEKVGKTGDQSMTGVLTAGGLLSNAGLIGYGVGAGGTVTQATSKSTGVTLNKPCGMITTHAESLAAGASVAVVLNNYVIASTDVVVATTSYHSGAGPNYRVTATTGLTGQCAIILQNISGAARAEAIEIHFAVIKATQA